MLLPQPSALIGRQKGTPESSYDLLTGLANRSHFATRVTQHLASAARPPEPRGGDRGRGGRDHRPPSGILAVRVAGPLRSARPKLVEVGNDLRYS